MARAACMRLVLHGYGYGLGSHVYVHCSTWLREAVAGVRSSLYAATLTLSCLTL